jgi:hypothetical protein
LNVIYNIYAECQYTLYIIKVKTCSCWWCEQNAKNVCLLKFWTAMLYRNIFCKFQVEISFSEQNVFAMCQRFQKWSKTK